MWHEVVRQRGEVPDDHPSRQTGCIGQTEQDALDCQPRQHDHLTKAWGSPLAESYTKLSSSIVYSTIWQESLHVKVVWVTMLAISDAAGYVGASIPGLAKVAGVSVKQCSEAIDLLKSPDKHSRNPANEGRRIEAAAGGWILLNYVDYRDQQAQNIRREQNRKAQAKRRAAMKAQGLADIADGQHDKHDRSAMSAQAEAEAVPTSSYKEISTPTVEKSVDNFSDCAKLIIALNQGLFVRFGDNYTPVAPSQSASMDAAAEILALVPLDFALEQVRDIASKYKPSGRSKQITSLLYCRNGVIDRWERFQAKTDASGPALGVTSSKFKPRRAAAAPAPYVKKDPERLSPEMVESGWSKMKEATLGESP